MPGAVERLGWQTLTAAQEERGEALGWGRLEGGSETEGHMLAGPCGEKQGRTKAGIGGGGCKRGRADLGWSAQLSDNLLIFCAVDKEVVRLVLRAVAKSAR